MAKAGARVHIYGDWDGTGVKKAKQDLSGFQKQAQGFTGAIGKSFMGMGAAIGGAFALGSVISFAKDFSLEAINMAQESQKTTVRLEAIAKSMGIFGTVLGGTTKRLEGYAQELQNATGISDETTKSAQAILLTFSELAVTAGEAGGMFDRATAALLDLSAAGFGDAETNAKSLGKALQDPIKGLTALGRQGITFTQQEKDKIRTLVETNQTLEAQNLIMAAVEKQVGGTAAAVANDFDKIKAAADDAKEIIGFALMDAVENLADAMGGSGNLNDAILQGGEYIADFVAGMGLATIALTDFLNISNSATGETDEVNQSFLDAGISILDFVFHTNLAAGALWDWTVAGAEYRDEQKAITEVNDLATQRYEAMAVALGITEVSTEALAAQTADAEEAMKALAEEVKALQGTLSNRQAQDDFAKYLRDLDEQLEGNKRTFKGMSDSALENRDTLRTAFSDAASVVHGFVEEGRISESEFAGVFAGTGKKIVDDLIAQGFKPKDIKAFLKSEGLWSKELAAIFKKDAMKEPLGEAENLGYDIASGVSVGFKAGTPALKTAVSGTVLAAIQAGKNAAKIESPSKVTQDEIGIPLIDGIIQGMKVKKEDLKSTTQDVVGEALDIAQGIIDEWDATVEKKFNELEGANQAIADWVSSTSSSLQSAFDLSGVFESSMDENGQLMVGKFQGGVEAALAEFQWYTNVLSAIGAAPGSEQLVAFLQSQGITNGGAWGQALIDKGLVQYMIDSLGTVTTTADTTAQALVPPFLKSAQQSSQALYDEYVKDYGKDGEKRKKLEALMDRLARSLDRTSTITIRTVYEAAGLDGEKAAGGPVSANKAYLVGERGPEVLVMGSQSGTIIPNGDLPTASGTFTRGGDGASMGGTSYTINVQAGVGDPRAIGQQVVEYIKRFESANGRVFAAA